MNILEIGRDMRVACAAAAMRRDFDDDALNALALWGTKTERALVAEITALRARRLPAPDVRTPEDARLDPRPGDRMLTAGGRVYEVLSVVTLATGERHVIADDGYIQVWPLYVWQDQFPHFTYVPVDYTSEFRVDPRTLPHPRLRDGTAASLPGRWDDVKIWRAQKRIARRRAIRRSQRRKPHHQEDFDYDNE